MNFRVKNGCIKNLILPIDLLILWLWIAVLYWNLCNRLSFKVVSLSLWHLVQIKIPITFPRYYIIHIRFAHFLAERSDRDSRDLLYRIFNIVLVYFFFSKLKSFVKYSSQNNDHKYWNLTICFFVFERGLEKKGEKWEKSRGLDRWDERCTT